MVAQRAGSTMRRVHIYYTGRVQGVGFRLYAEEAATPLCLTGWVRNMRDGRVELLAEGPESQLNTLLDQVDTGPMQNFITKQDVSWSDATGEFQTFDIQYF
jgi:acylphosphatase